MTVEKVSGRYGFSRTAWDQAIVPKGDIVHSYFEHMLAEYLAAGGDLEQFQFSVHGWRAPSDILFEIRGYKETDAVSG